MKKWLVISGAVVVFLLLSLWLVPYFFKEVITREARTQINNRVNARVSFDEVNLSLLKYFPRMGITFENIKITGKDKFSGVDLLKADGLTLGINPWKILFQQKTDIKRLKLDKPVIHIIRLDEEHANYNILLADTLSYEDTTSTLNLSLEKITIEEGEIIYDDRSVNTLIQMSGVNHSGKIDVLSDLFRFDTKTHVKEFTCDYDHVRYSNKREVELDMKMEMNEKNRKFTFRENTITINNFKFGLEGSFTLLEKAYDLDLKFGASETSFKNIVSLIPGIYKRDFNHIKTGGDIAFKGFVKGIYADSLHTIPRFHVDINIKDGMFRIDTLPTPIKNIQLDLAIDNSFGLKDSITFDIKNFHLDLGKHPFHGRFRLTGLHNYKKIDADILANLDIAVLQTVYPIKGLSLKGRMDFELKAKGEYIYSHDKIRKVPAFHLDMKVAKGKVKYDSLPSSFDNIKFHLIAENPSGNIEETFIRINDINMHLGKNPLTGFISLKGYEKYSVDAAVKADLDLADLEKIYPLPRLALKGVFNMDIKTKGIYDHDKKKFPSVDARVHLQNGWLKSADYPEPMENINLLATAINNTGNFKDTQLNITDLTYTMEGDPFEVKGTVTDMNDYTFDLKINGRVNLEKITKIYPVQGMTLKGIIDSDFTTKGKISDIDSNAYRRIKSSGNIKVRDFELKSSSFPLCTVKEADFSFTPEKIIMEKLEGRAGKSRISLKGELTNYLVFAPKRKRRPGEVAVPKKRKPITGDLILTCDTLDLNEWMTSNKSSVPHSADGGTARPDTSGPLIISERIDFVFDSRIGFVKYQDLRLMQLVGEIRIKDGVVSLRETGFNSLDALFKLTGDYDTRDVHHPLIDFSIDIQDLDISRAYKELGIVRAMAPAAGDAEGTFSITYKLKGELDHEMKIKTETMTGGGEIRIANAKINGMKIFEEISKTAKKGNIKDPHLRDFVMNTEVRNNKIFIKPFSLKVSGFETEIEGVSELSGAMQYIFKIELLPIEKLKIPFHVSGTYDNPKVALGKGHTLPD
jgi:AsmA protein